MSKTRITTAPEAIQFLLNTAPGRVRVGHDPNRGDYLYKVNVISGLLGSKEERSQRHQHAAQVAYNFILKANEKQRDVDYVKLLFTTRNLPVLLNYVMAAKATPRETITQNIERPNARLVDQDANNVSVFGKDGNGKQIDSDREYVIDHFNYAHPERNEFLPNALEVVRQVPLKGGLTDRSRQGFMVDAKTALAGITMPKDGTAVFKKLVMHDSERVGLDFAKRFSRYRIDETSPNSVNGHILALDHFGKPTQTPEQYRAGLVSYHQVVGARRGEGLTHKDEAVQFSLGDMVSEPENLIAELSDGKRVLFVRARITDVEVPDEKTSRRKKQSVTSVMSDEVRGQSQWLRMTIDKKNRPISIWEPCVNPYINAQHINREKKKTTLAPTAKVAKNPSEKDSVRTSMSAAVAHAVDTPIHDDKVGGLLNYGLKNLERFTSIYEDGIERTFGISMETAQRLHKGRFTDEAIHNEFKNYFNGDSLPSTQRTIQIKNFTAKVRAYQGYMEVIFGNANPAIFFGDTSRAVLCDQYADRLPRYDALSHMQEAAVRIDSAKKVLENGIEEAFDTFLMNFHEARGAARAPFREAMVKRFQMIDNILIDVKNYAKDGVMDLERQREIVRKNLGEDVYRAYCKKNPREGAYIGKIANANDQTIRDVAAMLPEVVRMRKKMQEALSATYFHADSQTMYAQPNQYVKVMVPTAIPRPDEVVEKATKKGAHLSVAATPASYSTAAMSAFAKAQHRQLEIEARLEATIEEEPEEEEEQEEIDHSRQLVPATKAVAEEIAEVVNVATGNKVVVVADVHNELPLAAPVEEKPVKTKPLPPTPPRASVPPQLPPELAVVVREQQETIASPQPAVPEQKKVKPLPEIPANAKKVATRSPGAAVKINTISPHGLPVVRFVPQMTKSGIPVPPPPPPLPTFVAAPKAKPTNQSSAADDAEFEVVGGLERPKANFDLSQIDPAELQIAKKRLVKVDTAKVEKDRVIRKNGGPTSIFAELNLKFARAAKPPTAESVASESGFSVGEGN